MPYKTNQDLPPQVKALPEHGKTIFRKAFNSAFGDYGEERAFKIAWSAVERIYKKVKDQWVLKEGKVVAETYLVLTADGFIEMRASVGQAAAGRSAGLELTAGERLGAACERARVKAGLAPEELAAKLPVRLSAYMDIERGYNNNPPDDVLEAICEQLGMKVEDAKQLRQMDRMMPVWDVGVLR